MKPTLEVPKFDSDRPCKGRGLTANTSRHRNGLAFRPTPALKHNESNLTSGSPLLAIDTGPLTGTEELSYHIPEQVLDASLEQDTPWSHELYRGAEDARVTLHYCRSLNAAEDVAKLFLDKPVVGFDLEWMPNASSSTGLASNLSLIQLACEDRIALFHIALHRGDGIEQRIGPTLKHILESPSIVKAGVCITGDRTRIGKWLNVQMQATIELSHIYKLVKHGNNSPELVNRKPVRLDTQVQEHLLLHLDKGAVRFSEWDKPLNHEQCRYAASDAYACHRLFHVLEAKRLKMSPLPPRPHFAELGLPIALADGVALPQSVREAAVDFDEQQEQLDEHDLDDKSHDSSKRPDGSASLFIRLSAPHPSDDAHKLDAAPQTFDAKDSVAEQRRPSNTRSPGKLPGKSEPSAEILKAEEWIISHRARHSTNEQTRATQPQLRAYSLWHEQNLGMGEVAALLRSPPLKSSTVATYIMEAIRIDNLPFDKQRLKDVHSKLPYQALGMYKGMVNKFK